MLIGDTKQAKSEEKSGPVEIGLTGPAAMPLQLTRNQLFLFSQALIHSGQV